MSTRQFNYQHFLWSSFTTAGKLSPGKLFVSLLLQTVCFFNHCTWPAIYMLLQKIMMQKYISYSYIAIYSLCHKWYFDMYRKDANHLVSFEKVTFFHGIKLRHGMEHFPDSPCERIPKIILDLSHKKRPVMRRFFVAMLKTLWRNSQAVGDLRRNDAQWCRKRHCNE